MESLDVFHYDNAILSIFQLSILIFKKKRTKIPSDRYNLISCLTNLLSNL